MNMYHTPQQIIEATWRFYITPHDHPGVVTEDDTPYRHYKLIDPLHQYATNHASQYMIDQGDWGMGVETFDIIFNDEKAAKEFLAMCEDAENKFFI